MAENLHSYVVALNFAVPGILIVGAYVAPDAASAGAIAALEAAQKMRELDAIPPLINCLVVEESVEHLRHRLRIIEGGKPGGDVVSLVQQRDPDLVAAEILLHPAGHEYLQQRSEAMRAQHEPDPAA